MKRASDITKLPIVGMKEGEQVATVKDLYVSRKTKAVEYLSVVKNKDDILPCFLPFKDITGIGSDYIIIPSLDRIKEIHANDKMLAALEDCLTLTGRTVLASMGDVIGSISDYMINVKTALITSLALDSDREIGGDKLVSLSAKFIVVDALSGEDAGSALDDGSMTYLLGKTVSSDIVGEGGSFTIKKGTVLTKELIVEAEAHDMLLMLTMNV